MNSALPISVGCVFSAKAPAITPLQTTWAEFVESLSTPQIRETKDGGGYVLATFSVPYRKSENITGITAVGLDIDGGEGTPPPRAAHEFLVGQGWRHCVVTTWSHDPKEPRYRVLIAIDRPLNPHQLRTIHETIRDAFPSEIGGAVDRACLGDRARLFYAPACSPDRAELFEHYHGDGLPLCSETLEALAQVIESERHNAQQRAVNPPQRRQWAGGGDSVIEQFNQAYTVESILEAGGYVKKGRKWIAPTSQSRMPGITVFGNKVFSHHASDPLRSGHAEDAFGAFALIFHAGDQKAAAAAIRKEARHGRA